MLTCAHGMCLKQFEIELFRGSGVECGFKRSQQTRWSSGLWAKSIQLLLTSRRGIRWQLKVTLSSVGQHLSPNLLLKSFEASPWKDKKVLLWAHERIKLFSFPYGSFQSIGKWKSSPLLGVVSEATTFSKWIYIPGLQFFPSENYFICLTFELIIFNLTYV